MERLTKVFFVLALAIKNELRPLMCFSILILRVNHTTNNYTN